MVGGPNGAGKTTISRAVIAETLGIAEFVNADFIAQGLSGFDPDRAALQAGRVMLLRLRELAATRADFAFETTLASRTFAPWLASRRADGYRVLLVFVFLASADLAIRRVRARVQLGGHSVPSEVVARRYTRGISNLVNLYLPLADEWRVYDNSSASGGSLVVAGIAGQPVRVLDDRVWRIIHEIARQPPGQDDQ